MLIDFVENDCSRRFIRIEFGVGPCSAELILVFVGCLGVLAVKCAADTDLQNQLSIRIVLCQLHFTV